MATLRTDGRWVATKRDPQGKRISGYGKTAEAAEADLKAKLIPTLTWRLGPSTTLSEFAEHKWRPNLARIDEASVKRYVSSYAMYIAAQIGGRLLSELKRADVDEWINSLRAKGATEASIHYARYVFSNICLLAVDYELIDRNPAARVKLPPRAAKRERRLSAAHAAEMLASVSTTPLSAPVFLAAVLGLRRGEIAGLKWSDLDRQRGELRILRQRRASKGNGVIEKDLKTTASTRTLMLPRPFVDEIDRRGNLDSDYVCTLSGKPWVPDTITEHWVDARKDLKLGDWTFHDLRHGAAGLLYASGCDLIEIAAVLGHKKPDMSWLYTSSSEEAARGALSGLATSLGM